MMVIIWQRLARLTCFKKIHVFWGQNHYILEKLCDGRRRTEIAKLGSVLVDHNPQRKSNAQNNQNLIWLCRYLFKMFFSPRHILSRMLLCGCFGPKYGLLRRAYFVVPPDRFLAGWFFWGCLGQTIISFCFCWTLCCAFKLWSGWFWVFVLGQKQFASVRVLCCVYCLQSPDTSLVLWSTCRTLPQSAAELCRPFWYSFSLAECLTSFCNFELSFVQ